MPTSDEEREHHRWQLLRWAPRHDFGVLYQPGHPGEVWLENMCHVVPFLVSTGDFAPADMQYRMHREHLWDPHTGLYGDAYNVDTGTWVRQVPTASGNARIAAAMAQALHIGGDGTPAEMRGRWQRETRALFGAMAVLDVDDESAELLAQARELSVRDGWDRPQP